MKIWRHSKLDAMLFILSIIQLTTMVLLAKNWESSSLLGKVGNFALLVAMMVYNIIIVSHLFTHTPWFKSEWLNSLVSILNSINIGQSVQAYHITHVRNHHRYHNDLKEINGKTYDFSSTYQDGENGNHSSLFRYAFIGGASSFYNHLSKLFTITRLWGVGKHEKELLNLLSNSVDRRRNELRQVQLDRIAHLLGLSCALFISWQWTLICYLPAYYLSLALVNVQNYYEHFGATPTMKAANSVSYYGRLYNLLSFNDGYHQEHHFRSGAHWSTMPEVRVNYQLDQVERIISPVPAIFGFLHFKRKQLNHLFVNTIDLGDAYDRF